MWKLPDIVLQLDIHPTPEDAAIWAAEIHFNSRVRVWGRYQELRKDWKNNWLRTHLERTMDEAKRYAILPALKTIYLWQRLWKITRGPTNNEAALVPCT